MEKNLKKVIQTPLSDQDLRTILGERTKITKYSDLGKYKSVEELLPNPNDFVIILLEEKQIQDTGRHYWGIQIHMNFLIATATQWITI